MDMLTYKLLKIREIEIKMGILKYICTMHCDDKLATYFVQ